jgi:RNA recognition motif-containing protein
METKLYVGNLSYTTSEDELRTLFSQAGTVASAVVITDRDTGASKGFGFVEMASQADARQAIKMLNAHELGEHALLVELAQPHEERSNRLRLFWANRANAVNLTRLRRNTIE